MPSFTMFLAIRRVQDFMIGPLLKRLQAVKQRKMKIKFEDPYEQEEKNWEPLPDVVDRLGGRNMKLSGQAVLAITN